MIRTGYLRWEVEVVDDRSPQDPQAREVRFLARPTHRVVRVKSRGHSEAAERFTRGEGAYDEVLRTLQRGGGPEVDLTVPDVGPHVYRYSEADRAKMIRYWMEKLQREASAFAHEVVRVASSFPQLVIASPALRAGYARLVEAEVFRVIEGKSTPQPTSDVPVALDEAAYQQGVPELVAAELVRNVVEPKEFHEFCQYDMITVKAGDKFYRIPRRPHSLIEVWDAATRRPLARLCVVFQDPGMPPSDEVVMKYLLAKHQPDMLWQVGVRFGPPTGKFEARPPRRWTLD
jgi:hypothetical protein